MANDIQWLAAIALVFLTARSFTESATVNLSEIHHHMTKVELLSVFKVPGVESVPDYEIATVTRANHRSRRSIHDGDQQTYYMNSGNRVLALRHVDNLLLDENTPVYLASGDKSQPHGIRYIRKKWASKLSVYRDDEKQAVVAMSVETDAENQRVRFEGIIGNDYVIKPVPWRFLDDEDDNNHLIYKRQTNRTDDTVASLRTDDYLPSEDGLLMAQHTSDVDVVYPEVLVIVDHSTYLAHGSSLRELCKYMSVFWHAVDSRYRTLRQPQVRLNIAGLIVSTDIYGTPYIASNTCRKYVFSEGTVYELGAYLSEEDRIGSFDVAMALTNLDMMSPNGRGSYKNTVLGMATLGGACGYGRRGGLIEDHGDMYSALTAAHELGHLFGSQHDGDGDSEDCPASEGYIMAPEQEEDTDVTTTWSQCSLQQMRYFFRSKKGRCMYNKPRVNRPVDIEEELEHENPEEHDAADNSVNDERRKFIEGLKDNVNRLLDYYNYFDI